MSSLPELNLITEDVLAATGTSLPNFKEFLRSKFVTPTHKSTGARQRNGYSFADAVQTRLVRMLHEADFHRTWIPPIAFGLPLLSMDSVRNPFSLKFLSDCQFAKSWKNPRVSLEVVHCGTFYKVGFRVQGDTGYEVFNYKIIKKSRKGFKPVSQEGLTDEELKRLAAQNITVHLVLNEIHQEVKEKLTSMGLV